MTLSDSDRLLVNDGSKTNTITFAQFKDGSVLNPTDLFLVNDGTKTETISWEQIEDELGPKGTVNTPTVLAPADGAGSGDTRYLKSDTIIDVEGGGIDTCETELIQSVSGSAPNITLTFPSAQGFDCFEPGDVVQDGGQNQSYKWSDGGDNNVKSGEPWANAFNGKADDPNCVAQDGTTARITFPANTRFNKIELSYWCSGDQSQIFNVNGDDVSSVRPNSASNGVFVDVTSLVSGNTLIYIEFNNTDNSNPNVFSAVRLDGKLLTDSDGAFAETQAKIISKDADAVPPTITVDGGDWLGSDGSGTANGDTTLVKETPYDVKLTVASDKDLADMTGSVFMTTDIGGGPYTQSPYKLTTTDIESVEVLNEFQVAQYDTAYGWAAVNGSETNQDHIESATVTGWTTVTEFTKSSGNAWAIDFGEAIRWDINRGSHNPTFYASSDNVTWNYLGTFSAGGALSPTASQLYNFTLDSQNANGTSRYVMLITSGNSSYVDKDGFGTTLTFAGDVSTNPDLKFFRPGDVIQQPDVKVVSTDLVNNTMVVDGGEWDTSNQSQVWSNLFTSPSAFTRDKERAFDGDTTTAADTTDGWTLDLSGVTFGTGDHVVTVLSGGADSITVNSTPLPDPGGTGVKTWTGTVNGEINTIFSSVTAASCRGIYIDDKLLVDAVNDSQVWSDSLTSSGTFDLGPEYAFDGIIEPSNECRSGDGDTLTFAPTGGIPFTTSVEVYNQSVDNQVIVNTEPPVAMNAARTWFTVATGPGTINTMQFSDTTNGKVAFGGIKVDGKLLIDTGARDLGDTSVEYQTNGGEGTIVSVNTDDNTLLIANTSDRDERWIAENKAATDFYVAGPSVIDEPLLTTDVQLQCSEFATTPDGVDGLKEIIWNLNGVDQPGTTLNPYKPTGLAFNTEYTVKVKHVANSIGESEWSASTKFTTGASRSLKEHYVSKILHLEEALKEAQAKPKRSRKKAD